MSIRLERWMRSLVHGRYGRWVMLGLLVAILAGFTVMSEIGDWLFQRSPSASASDVAGTFAVLPGSQTAVTYSEFDAARRRYGLALAALRRSPQDRVRDLDVWTHLVLLEAARKEGIAVSNEDLKGVIGRIVPEHTFQDAQQYKKYVQQNFGVSAEALETAVLEYLTTIRLRELYAESFTVAPPATRKAAVEQSAGQSMEHAFGDYAVLDASNFLADAEAELKAEADPEAKLREFFDKDPAVRLEPEKFRHPSRFRLELLYTIHAKIDTDETLERIHILVLKAFPGAKIKDPDLGDQKQYYGAYRDRLLQMMGSSREKVEEEVQKAPPGEDEPKEPDGEPKPPPSAPDPQRVLEHGYQIAKHQVAREVGLREIYNFLYSQAKDNVSLKEIFAKLQEHDDPEHPVCSLVSGQGLIVFLDGKNALTGDELTEIEDSGVKFGFGFRPRVTGLLGQSLPKLSPKPDTLGDQAHGRQFFRLLEVIPDQRKTYEELTAGEKEDLRRLFYLPTRARDRAKERLEALRQKFVEGAPKADRFRAEAEALGCRVREKEWIDATFDYQPEPDEKQLWPDEYLHMRDRHFLRKSLAQLLERDRAKKELAAGTFLPVDVDLKGKKGGPGAAYLFYLRERKTPDATTIPPAEISTWLKSIYYRRAREEAERWTDQPERLREDFRMEFSKDMQPRIDEEMKRREEGRRKGR
jgi:hypothetical protein